MHRSARLLACFICSLAIFAFIGCGGDSSGDAGGQNGSGGGNNGGSSNSNGGNVSEQGAANVVLSGGVEAELNCEATGSTEPGSLKSFKRDGEKVFSGEAIAGIGLSCTHDFDVLVGDKPSVNVNFYVSDEGGPEKLEAGEYPLNSFDRSPSWYSDRQIVADLSLDEFFDDFGMAASISEGAVTVDESRMRVGIFNGSLRTQLKVDNDDLGIEEEGEQQIELEADFRAGQLDDIEKSCESARESCGEETGAECFEDRSDAEQCDCESELKSLYECRANQCAEGSEGGCESEQQAFDDCAEFTGATC